MMNKPMVVMFALFMSLNVSPAVDAEALLSAPTQRAVVAKHALLPPFVGARFARTELYFGTARSNNKPPVSEAEFQGFLDNNITQAFPDGLTLFKGVGQFRGANGVTVQETSFLVILLYPAQTRWESSVKIEQLRQDYKDQFEQESVLRADFCCERVGF
jgi:hypothetical protein